MGMRVVLVNRYFHPDHSATSQMAEDLAFFLAARGWDVTAVTSRQLYDEPNARLPRNDSARGVRIVRVWSSRFGRDSLAGRAIDYATFYVSSLMALTRNVKKGDVVLALTDPPLISVIAALAARLRGARLVNWIQDLFPEVAEGLGVLRRQRVLRALRQWSLRRAETNVALSEAMAKRIGIRTAVRHNWAAEDLRPVPRDRNPLRDEWNLGSRFVVAYSGNLGRAHDAATLTGAMRLLSKDHRITFLIVGSGARLDDVRREGSGDNVQFRPYQPRERLSESLSAGDAHIVSLQPQLEGLIVPSKIYGVMAVGRPVIYIGDAESDLGRLIADHQCGIAVAPGDSEKLAGVIRAFADDPSNAEEMGRRGRALFESRFAPALALSEWEQILKAAAHA
jgi:glycosyltransferase involved in cell wall biosynthesis